MCEEKIEYSTGDFISFTLCEQGFWAFPEKKQLLKEVMLKFGKFVKQFVFGNFAEK